MANSALARRRIQFLPPQLANQIAAGEVVERPASVLKELVENSLDAEATRIDIDVEAGGVALIRVSDNGCGIEREDLVLALSRHATSKVGAVEDLYQLRTLGFRGEALASIGSVAHLSLTSRAAGADVAWGIRVGSGDEKPVPYPASRPAGTAVDVRDLFYNVPARRKFLRTERTELAHLEDVVKRMSLSNPGVTFTLRHHDRVLVQSPAAADHAGRARRVAAVFGNAFIAEARWVEADTADMSLWGWLGPAELTRSQTDLQYLYVNGRIVRDRLLSHALRQAYQDALAPGRHPVYVLHFEIAPALVDVNVHPTKHEVRFRDARSVHDFVFASVRRALEERGETALPGGSPASRHPSGSYAPAPERVAGAGSIAEPLRSYPGSTTRPKRAAAEGSPLGRALGLVGERILVAAQAERLLIVDLDCAQRLLWRRDLLSALEGGDVVGRPLLIPVSATVPAAQADAAETAASRLARVGLDVSRSGADQIMVRAVPWPLAESVPESLAVAALEYLSAVGVDEVSDEALVGALVGAASTAHRDDPGELDGLLRKLAAACEPEPGAGGGPCWVALEPASLQTLLKGSGERRDAGDETP